MLLAVALSDTDPPPPPHDNEDPSQMIYEVASTPFDDSIYAERQPKGKGRETGER